MRGGIAFIAIFFAFVPILTWQATLQAQGGSPVVDVSDSSGSLFIQLFGVSLFASSILLARIYRIPTRVIVLTLLPAGLFLAWALLSTGWSEFPALTIRRAARLAIETSTATLLALTFRSQKEFLSILLWAFLVIMALDILSLAVPSLSFSLSGEFQGVHLYKNEAGMFLFAALFVFGMVMVRSSSLLRFLSASVLCIAIILLYLSHAKSAIGCGLLALALVGLTRIVTTLSSFGRTATVLCCLLALGIVAMFLFNLGIDEVLTVLFGDATLTGRDQLWRYVGLKSYFAPLQGIGYGALWMVGPDIDAALKATGAKWLAVQAHNGYIDVQGQTGYVGLALLFLFLAVTFSRLYRYAISFRGNFAPQLSDYAIYIFWGVTIFNITESSFFRSGQPLWFLFLFVTSFVSGQVIRNTNSVDLTRLPLRRRERLQSLSSARN